MPENRIQFLDRVLTILVYAFVAFSLISIAGTHITLGILVVVWMARMVLGREWLIRRTPLDLAFLLFLVAFLIATVFSLRPTGSLMNLKNVLLIAVVYLVAFNLRSRDEVLRAADILVFTAACMAVLGIVIKIAAGRERVMALQSTTMTWGAMSAIFVLITTSLVLFGPKGRKRALYIAAWLVQFVSMLFTYVRGAWLGFAAGFLVLALLKSKKLVLVGVLLLVLIFLLVPDSLQTRILSVTDLNVGSTQVRLAQWKNALKIFRDHPLTGVGWIDLIPVYRKYAPDGADLTSHVYSIGHVHNNFFMFLVYFGIPGVAAALYLMILLFQTEIRIFRRVSKDTALSALVLGSIAAMTGFWINGLFDWTFGDAEPVTLLWLTVGLCLAAGRAAIVEEA
jgi:O-antigen ligase